MQLTGPIAQILLAGDRVGGILLREPSETDRVLRQACRRRGPVAAGSEWGEGALPGLLLRDRQADTRARPKAGLDPPLASVVLVAKFRD